MAIIEAVPELSDGGYWYHVSLKYQVNRPTGQTYLDEEGLEQQELETLIVGADELLPGENYVIRPNLPAVAHRWFAWYISDGTVVVKSEKMIIGVDTISFGTAKSFIDSGRSERPNAHSGVVV